MKKTKKHKGVRHHIKRVHRHIKKHLQKLKKKRPRVHKAVVLMSVTLPIVLGTLLFGSSALYYYQNYFDDGSSEEKITVNLPSIKDDTTNWKTYRDDRSGFSIKYSDHWNDPKILDSKEGTKYLKKILFDNGLSSSDEKYNGFAVFIYDAKDYPNPVGTDSLEPKTSVDFQQSDCSKAEFGEASLGEEGYPAQEVDIVSDNECFRETYFFSMTRGNYTYNIVPLIGSVNNSITEGIKSDIISFFPKFFEITSTILVPLPEKQVEEKPDPGKLNVVKKKPVEPRRSLVHLAKCAHKNDHPRKSRTKKHRHMDEDCCMDPDEWPNPRCQY